MLLGIGLMFWLERKDRLLVPGWLDGVIVSLVSGIAGGRIIFVLANWLYYKQNVEEIFLLTEGGLNYHGTLIAGIVVLWLWLAWRRREFGLYAALIAIPMAVASALGWFACWLDGCAYGRLADFSLLTADLPDSFGVYGLRYQTQLMGIVLCLLVTAILFAFRRRLKPIHFFWVSLLLLSTVHLAVGLYRGDSAPIVGQFRLDTVADASLILVCLIALAYSSYALRQRGAPPGVSPV